jgi:hypothetical protein
LARRQNCDHRAGPGQSIIHWSAEKGVNPCPLRQHGTKNGSGFLIECDPACHGQTIREFELREAAIILMQAARSAFDRPCFAALIFEALVEDHV